MKKYLFAFVALLSLVECTSENAGHSGNTDTASAQSPKFPTWKTIVLGRHTSVSEYISALKASGVIVVYSAQGLRDTLPDFPICATEQEIELVRISSADLGIFSNRSYQKICMRAKELGLEYCPPEVGLALREQYRDQPKTEGLGVMLESSGESDAFHFFVVGYSLDGTEMVAYQELPAGAQVHREPDSPNLIFCKKK